MPDQLTFTQAVVNEDLSDVEKISFSPSGDGIRVVSESEARMLVTAFTLSPEYALELERWLAERRKLQQHRFGET